MDGYGRRMRFLVSALVAAVALVCTASAAAAPLKAKPNNDSRFLQVYVNNIENLETSKERCRGNWKNLIDKMRAAKVKPDLFLVQQLSGKKQLRRLTERMNNLLGERYTGIYYRKRKKQTSPCGKAKAYQVNAIVWRENRLSPPSLPRRFGWQSDSFQKRRKGKSHCRNSGQTRAHNLGVVLRDTRNPFVSVAAASFHWPTKRAGGHPCARENAREAAQQLGAQRTTLSILGGDSNITTNNPSGRGWHGLITGRQFEDPFTNEPTIHGRRIDFLFARRGADAPAPVFDQRVVPFAKKKLPYSDHRALKAKVAY